MQQVYIISGKQNNSYCYDNCDGNNSVQGKNNQEPVVQYQFKLVSVSGNLKPLTRQQLGELGVSERFRYCNIL